MTNITNRVGGKRSSFSPTRFSPSITLVLVPQYNGHRPRSGIENRWPKSKAKVKGVLLLELFGSLIPKII